MVIDLPLQVFEATTMIATLWADTDALQRATPPELQVVPIFPNKSIVGVACIDYRSSTVGSYGEVGLAWPVVKANAPPWARLPVLPLAGGVLWPSSGWWVHQLPVTTQASLDAGRMVWGYPKFLARIEFEWDGRNRICTLAQNGIDILQLTMDTQLPAVPQRLKQRTYTRLAGQLLATQMSIEGIGFGRLERTRTTLELGPHDLGRELASFGVKNGRPAMSQWFPIWRAVLPGPVPVPP